MAKPATSVSTDVSLRTGTRCCSPSAHHYLHTVHTQSRSNFLNRLRMRQAHLYQIFRLFSSPILQNFTRIQFLITPMLGFVQQSCAGGGWLSPISYTITGQSRKLRMATRFDALAHSPGEIPLADRCELCFQMLTLPLVRLPPDTAREEARHFRMFWLLTTLATTWGLSPHSGHIGHFIRDIQFSEALILPIGL